MTCGSLGVYGCCCFFFALHRQNTSFVACFFSFFFLLLRQGKRKVGRNSLAPSYACYLFVVSLHQTLFLHPGCFSSPSVFILGVCVATGFQLLSTHLCEAKWSLKKGIFHMDRPVKVGQKKKKTMHRRRSGEIGCLAFVFFFFNDSMHSHDHLDGAELRHFLMAQTPVLHNMYSPPP